MNNDDSKPSVEGERNGEKTGLQDIFEPMEAMAANINYNDDVEISDEDRSDVCQDERCADHGDGSTNCPVPETWGELRDVVDDSENLTIPATRRDLDPDDDVYREPSAVGLPEDMKKQPVPSASRCPYCGGSPEPDSDPKHNLSAMGYRHDDIEQTCSQCNRNWPLGVPIGEYDGELAEDLFCESCEKRYMIVHRLEPNWNKAANHGPDEWAIRVHMKCPNCYYFKKIRRECDGRGISLMGYPQITGDTTDAEPEGYRSPGDV